MKHINFLLFIFFVFGQNSVFSQIPEINNDVFVTNELTVNSEKLEFSPTFYEDGILFISTKPAGRRFKVTDRRINKNIMSIFNSRRTEDGKLGKPELFALELLSTVHEGPLTFDRTADNIYFTRNNSKNNRRVKASDGIVKLQIYTAQRNASVWENVQKLPFNDDNSNAAHPSISVENDLLFFASDRPGGIGGMDLYVSRKIGEEWGEPKNLGPTINTELDDVFPYIHADGTLYFASGGHTGMGGLDLYSSKGSGSDWEQAVNLGAPFNSDKDDFGLIIDRDKKNGYFSSDRGGGLGQDDIYSFFSIEGLQKNEEEVPDFEKQITLNVFDEATSAMLEGAKITYLKLDEATLGNAISDITSSNSDTDLVLKLPVNDDNATGLTDVAGQFPITLNRGNYIIKVEKEGYASKQITINASNDVSEYNVPLGLPVDPVVSSGSGSGSDKPPVTSVVTVTGETGYYDNNGNYVVTSNANSGTTSGSGTTVSSTITEGTVIELPNIYYNFNEAGIRPDARKDLDALYDFLTKYSDIEVELSSHTDSRGGTRYNKRLSQKRAERAVAYLVNKGISKRRLVAKGYGESQLRNNCSDAVSCTETEHQYNRRTEVTITKMVQPITVKFINNDPTYISEAPSSVQNKKYRGSGRSSSSEVSSSQDPEYAPNGSYNVIAGAYSTMKNAKKKLERVRVLGYNNADIQSSGSYYHVIVGTYENSSKATTTVKRLKGQSIRAYIKRK